VPETWALAMPANFALLRCLRFQFLCSGVRDFHVWSIRAGLLFWSGMGFRRRFRNVLFHESNGVSLSCFGVAVSIDQPDFLPVISQIACCFSCAVNWPLVWQLRCFPRSGQTEFVVGLLVSRWLGFFRSRGCGSRVLGRFLV
jgi:hypothetical protein